LVNITCSLYQHCISDHVVTSIFGCFFGVEFIVEVVAKALSL
jgi:hypothetical protein